MPSKHHRLWLLGEALAKAKAFVAQLTLEGKAWMTTRQPGPCVGNILPILLLGFSGLCLQDGPLAIHAVDYASTCKSNSDVRRAKSQADVLSV